MDNSNQTNVRDFILLGLASTAAPYLQAFCFLLLLIMYIITLLGNLLLITVVRVNTQLQTPMYFFLTHLSIIDIAFSSTIVPKILANTLDQDKRISFLGCATQMYFHLALGATECLILAAMALDRYAAICKPLQYNTIMDNRLCLCLTTGSWTVCFLFTIMQTSFTFQLPYCKSNHVNHYFCEMPPLFRLSCRDTLFNEITVYIASGLFAISTFLLIFISYVHIFSNISNIKSNDGRYKAFSTCVSHLTVVFIYYGAIFFMYMRPQSSYSPNRDKIVSLLYTVVTPMLNPIIYSIRNKQVTSTIRMALTLKRNTYS
ncbi:olfactory receptor 5F1-like [Pelobates fuscus]|uniref:olfactory receptor 5F1-like n=1 Tax=Pelobates fuscus TaxID=191477 RepID=UPI002FE4B273